MPALELTVLKVVFGFSECLPDFSSIHADAVDSECLGYEMVHCILMQPVSTVDSHEVLPKQLHWVGGREKWVKTG